MIATLGKLGIGGVILVSVCMMIALLGRAWDWGPFGLVLAGACAGWLVAFASIMAAWTEDA